MKQAQVLHAVLQRQTPVFPPFSAGNRREKRLYDLFIRMSLMCWSFEPSERPSMDDVVQQCIGFFHLDQILDPIIPFDVARARYDLDHPYNFQPASEPAPTAIAPTETRSLPAKLVTASDQFESFVLFGNHHASPSSSESATAKCDRDLTPCQPMPWLLPLQTASIHLGI